MSRIGRLPIPVPKNVTVQLDGNKVSVTGPRGELVQEFHPNIKVAHEPDRLVVTRPNDERTNRALHGLTRALLANMVTGVTQGFRKTLVIEGVGYRAEQRGKSIILQVGYSHPVEATPPQGITLTTDPGGRTIIVEGNDKEMVGRVAAKIRAVREPEPYKGKGIAYQGEVVRRKAGKAGKAGG
ncbi:MAG: 50S ribosomal protein L6 [Chloroflexota bacterium]